MHRGHWRDRRGTASKDRGRSVERIALTDRELVASRSAQHTASGRGWINARALAVRDRARSRAHVSYLSGRFASSDERIESRRRLRPRGSLFASARNASASTCSPAPIFSIGTIDRDASRIDRARDVTMHVHLECIFAQPAQCASQCCVPSVRPTIPTRTHPRIASAAAPRRAARPVRLSKPTLAAASAHQVRRTSTSFTSSASDRPSPTNPPSHLLLVC